MAVSFTDNEKISIVQALRKAAMHRTAQVGMRKTTVDELVAEAGISKGAFYKFYPSKEYLFLDVLAQWYEGIYKRTGQILQKNAENPPRLRAATMLKAAWRMMWEQPLIRFCYEEIPLLLRKIPDIASYEHYQSVDDFITTLIDRSEVTLTEPKETVSAIVKMLFLSLLTASEVGKPFPEALDVLIDGACIRCIEE